MRMTPDQIEAVRQHAIQSFRVGPHSIHGIHHWRAVERHGLLIASEVGADLETVQLFAILHDCCRQDDESDLEHGPRAARMVRAMAGSLITMDPARLDALVHAIHHHTDGTTSNDPTIGTCWDADRLDLGRVGIIPSPSLMSTTAGRRIAELGSFYMFRREKG